LGLGLGITISVVIAGISLYFIFLAGQKGQMSVGSLCGIIGPVLGGIAALRPDFSCGLVFWLVFGGILLSAVGIILAAVASTPQRGIGGGRIDGAIRAQALRWRPAWMGRAARA
jgi:hypothetical protein